MVIIKIRAADSLCAKTQAGINDVKAKGYKER